MADEKKHNNEIKKIEVITKEDKKDNGSKTIIAKTTNLCIHIFQAIQLLSDRLKVEMISSHHMITL